MQDETLSIKSIVFFPGEFLPLYPRAVSLRFYPPSWKSTASKPVRCVDYAGVEVILAAVPRKQRIRPFECYFLR